MPSVQCGNCGLVVQVPTGGRRLCGCGTWVSCVDQPVVAVADPPLTVGSESWPKIEGDLSAIERLNSGYRRLVGEMSKSIVGQRQVIEELLIAIFARGHCLLVGVPGL